MYTPPGWAGSRPTLSSGSDVRKRAYGAPDEAHTTHTSGRIPAPLFSFTNVPRQPVKVPLSAGAPELLSLMIGRLAVTFVSSEFVWSPLTPPAMPISSGGHCASIDTSAPLPRSASDWVNWTVTPMSRRPGARSPSVSEPSVTSSEPTASFAISLEPTALSPSSLDPTELSPSSLEPTELSPSSLEPTELSPRSALQTVPSAILV